MAGSSRGPGPVGGATIVGTMIVVMLPTFVMLADTGMDGEFAVALAVGLGIAAGLVVGMLLEWLRG